MGARGPLLERSAELAVLAGAVDEAREGSGRLVTIRGPAGMGKTSLLAVAAEHAVAVGVEVLSAHGSELARRLPYAVARELLEGALRSRTPAARARLLSGGAALAASVLEQTADEPAPPDPGGALLGLYWLVANLADEGPLALLVDDLQWSDERSVDAIEFIVPRLAELPVAVIAAGRPVAAAAEPDPLARLELAQRDTARLVLGSLSAKAVATLLSQRTGRRVASEFAAACGEVTAGNPYYLSELASELHADGVAPTAAHVARVRELGPGAIARSTLVRLRRISPEAVIVARTIAVLGDGAGAGDISAHAGLEPEGLAEVLAALTRAAVLVDERPPRFAHPIVRTAILADLTAAERSAAHARAATILRERGAPASLVAVHLFDTEPGTAGEWAADVLRDAAAHARGQGAPASASATLRRALAEPAAAGDLELLRALGAVAFEAGEPDALDHLRAAMRGAVDPGDRALAALELAIPLASIGAVPEAVATLRQALEHAAELDGATAVELEAQLSGVALLDPPGAIAVLRGLEVREAEPNGGSAARRLHANVAQWVAMSGGSADRVGELARKALEGGHLLADAGANSPSFLYAVALLIAGDRFEEADDQLASALALARSRGSVSGYVTTSMLASFSAYRQGDLERAVAEARGAADTALLHGWGMGLPTTVGFLVDALVDRGELDAARAALAASGFGEQVPGGTLADAYLVARARLRLADGDLTAGVADLEELGRRTTGEGWSATVGTPTFRGYLAPALAATGEGERARALAAQELELARAWGAPRGIGVALRVQAGVSGDTAERIELFEHAVATLEPTRARLEHARALAGLGSALRRSGQASAARTPLSQAIEIADRCGASPLLATAQDELAATGARRLRRTLLHGVASLTPSERRIAGLAADGLSNGEIAQALFLSRKTIEMHLGNSYRKLGVKSRGELGDALSAGAGAGSATG